MLFSEMGSQTGLILIPIHLVPPYSLVKLFRFNMHLILINPTAFDEAKQMPTTQPTMSGRYRCFADINVILPNIAIKQAYFNRERLVDRLSIASLKIM